MISSPHGLLDIRQLYIDISHFCHAADDVQLPLVKRATFYYHDLQYTLFFFSLSHLIKIFLLKIQIYFCIKDLKKTPSECTTKAVQSLKFHLIEYKIPFHVLILHSKL